MNANDIRQRESQRVSATKPRVARNELPWVNEVDRSNPERVVAQGERKRGCTMPGIRQRLLERIPKGFRNKAQGCEGRATLGKGGRCFTTPTGLRPVRATAAGGRNPFRVVIDRPHDPRVARSSQPWALLRNPFGIRQKNWRMML